MTAAEVTSAVAETQTLTSTKTVLLFLIGLMLIGGVSADYYYNQDRTSMGDWGDVPQFESHEELVGQFVAPFLFITILLQFSLKKALAYTFAGDDDIQNPLLPNSSGPNVDKEATVMALSIASMLVVSPYWTWIQTMAASIGLIAVGALILVFLFLIYMFVRP